MFKEFFDPQTLQVSPYLNGSLYTSIVYSGAFGSQNDMIVFAVDPLNANSAVADFNLSAGYFYNGLTYDDVGGLSYLLSTNNVNYETLLPSVVGVGINANSYVNGAWRPGVDKITFIPQFMDSQSAAFLPMTNYFTDYYMTNGILKQQQMARVISQPDFLFSAGADMFRTGTTNWINNAGLNNNLSGGGPGIIQPPVVIAFQKLSGLFYSSSSGYGPIWSEDSAEDVTSSVGTFGTFDGSTNAPVGYPVTQTGDVGVVVRVMLSHANYANDFGSFEWSLTSQAGTMYSLQTSTNMLTWNTLFEATNNSGVYIYRNVNANGLSRFYRLIPQ